MSAPGPGVGFPAEFRARAAALLGEEADAFLAALAAPVAGLRVNTLRLDAGRFREVSPFELRPLAFPAEGFELRGDARAGRHPYHAAGLYYLQDPGAMAVAALVAPRPGERVLDLAAAPGGKATHLAARMGDEGLLVANDVHPTRARELAGNLERLGVTSAVVTVETPARLAARLGAFFDRVLLDAPCSGEAMFHKSQAAREEWSPAAVLGCARRQAELLGDAARLVRPGGVLVYSTCTFSPEEDEDVVGRFLEGHGDFEALSLPAVPGGRPARPEWAAGAASHPEVARALRLWPHHVPGAGHFVAALRRHDGPASEARPPRAAAPPVEARRLLEGFRREALDTERVEGPLAVRGSELYRLPALAPALDGLRVARPGWWLGTLLRDRFEPAHALAMALRAGEARRSVLHGADDPATRAYLAGEPLTAPGERGWTLVTVNGFPLGWGKRVGDTVKNHLPKGLRWR